MFELVPSETASSSSSEASEASLMQIWRGMMNLRIDLWKTDLAGKKNKWLLRSIDVQIILLKRYNHKIYLAN